MHTRSKRLFAQAPSTLEVICDLSYQDPTIVNKKQIKVIRDKLETKGDPKDFAILTRLDKLIKDFKI
jgi:hypothetical protein